MVTDTQPQRDEPHPIHPTPYRPSWGLVVAIMSGTLLNPLNSSMIAVALISLQSAFGVGTATASWLISGFYLAAAIGMPVMGRLADLLGARRVFCAGLVLVGAIGALAPLAPSFGFLVAFRILQAFGTSAAYPAGLAILRRGDPAGKAPASALGALTVAGSISAALGPVLGGSLVGAAGWQAIFLVNVPVTVAGLLMALRWLPKDEPRATRPSSSVSSPAQLWHTLDFPGILLFSGTIAAALGFLISLSGTKIWPLLVVALLGGGLLFWRERRAATPFLDVTMLAQNRSLLGIFLQYAAINIVFYGIFFGLPLWLERARAFHPQEAGLLVLPVAGMGVISTPIAAWLVRRHGARPALIIGSTTLLAGSLLLLLPNLQTPLVVIVFVGCVLGIPNGFNNLGLQAALYEITPPEIMGQTGGQFQTFRYIGAILSTALLGLIFGSTATSTELHTMALVLAIISALLLLASIGARRQPRERTSRAAP
ncbi:MAG TPA: MFS transporter [Chloroflexota bacterium]